MGWEKLGVERLSGGHDDEQSAFQLIGEGLTELVGFGAAAINIVRGGELEVVAVTGIGAGDFETVDGEAQDPDEMVGTRWPVSILEEQLAKSEDWGRFRFIPHERVGRLTAGWVPRIEPDPRPDAWHPLDLLVAPVYDSDGMLCGTLSLDAPRDGLRPSPAARRLMEKYAEQADRAIVTMIERERLTETARLLDAARTVVRRATGQRSRRAVLAETAGALKEAFGAVVLWIRVAGAGSDVSAIEQQAADVHQRRDLRMAGIAERTARQLWDEGRVTVVDLRTPATALGNREDLAYVQEYLHRHGFGAILYVPLGAGPECLGSLTIVRAADAPPFSEAETVAARDIGQDLGSMLLHARNLERERRLVRELRELDAFKTGLIARVADELSTPLAAIVADVDALHDDRPPDQAVVARLHESARRMARMADNLLALARADGPRPRFLQAVDLTALVERVVQADEAAGPPSVTTVLPPYAVVVPGDASELEQVLTALVANARAYTPADGSVTVRLERTADAAELVVSDTGIGIAPEDLGRVFDEFFRSADPAVQERPGSGLGLAIVDRLVRRHDGWVTVRSIPGRGATFTVSLRTAER